MRRDRHPLTRLAVAAALAGAVGCTTWRTHPDVRRAIAAQDGRVLRLRIYPDGRPVGPEPGRVEPLTLRNAWVAGDSAIGEAGDERRRRAVALADIREVATRRIAVGRTLALVAVPTALAGVAVIAAIARVSY